MDKITFQKILSANARNLLRASIGHETLLNILHFFRSYLPQRSVSLRLFKLPTKFLKHLYFTGILIVKLRCYNIHVDF